MIISTFTSQLITIFITHILHLVDLLIIIFLNNYRSDSFVTGHYCSSLLKTLYSEKCLSQLFADNNTTADSSKVIKTISDFISAYIARLIWAINHAVLNSPIKLLGAVSDGERTRRYYTSCTTPSSSTQEMKWVEINNESNSNNTTLDDRMLDELLHLLKSLVSLPLSSTAKTCLSQNIMSSCKEREVNDDCLQYAKDKMLLLNLIYYNQHQLSALLQAACCHDSTNNYTLSRQFANVMNLLRTNCVDFVCWKQPLIDLLKNSSSSQCQFVYSDILFDLMNRFCLKNDKVDGALEEEKSVNEEDKDYEQLMDFVTQGLFSCCLFMNFVIT